MTVPVDPCLYLRAALACHADAVAHIIAAVEAMNGRDVLAEAQRLAAQIASLRVALLPDAGIDDLIGLAAAGFAVGVSDITGPGRTAELFAARQSVALMARQRGYSLTGIARALNRDHSTVSHMIRRAGGAGC